MYPEHWNWLWSFWFDLFKAAKADGKYDLAAVYAGTMRYCHIEATRAMGLRRIG